MFNQTAKRCSENSKTTLRRCKNPARIGQTTCWQHDPVFKLLRYHTKHQQPLEAKEIGEKL